MPSPFPGMDPYLENPEVWPNAHARLIADIQETLNLIFRPKYYAWIESRIDDEIPETQLQIFESETRRLVTVIEILSPTNKIAGSAGRESYLRKRAELLQSPVQWVEIDLLREGARLLGGKPYPTCDYTVYVSWLRKRPRAKIWPIFLRQRLPIIPIPLLDVDQDAQLNLREVLDKTYDKSAFDVSLNYKSEAIPPLSPDDAAWADTLLKEKGLR
jgi:Protein of unknown function (DUF4058)